MATIYDTPVTVYSGVDFNPDGMPVSWEYATAFFDDDDEDWHGEYLFAVDGEEMYPTGSVGNANSACTSKTYRNYAEYAAEVKAHV